jgi:hypothetical protein
MRRRELLLAAGAAWLYRPAPVAAAESDVLDGLIVREEGAAFAYRARRVLAAVALHEDHAKALRTLVDALGRKGPPAPSTLMELDEPARRLAEAGSAAFPVRAIALQDSLLEDYREALTELAEPSILRTVASITASHAQYHALLRREAGMDPLG